MRHITIGAAALSLSAGAAMAGGIERSPQSVGLLFEPGKVVQLGFGNVSPDLSGSFPVNGASSGDMAPSFTSLSLGAKMAVNDRIDIAVIYDQSLGADVDYGGAQVGYPLRGLEANLDGSDVTALLRYRLGERLSVYGGFRVQKIDATLTGLPLGALANLYSLSVGRTQEYGYVVGAAYEIPDIALRVALTYNSAIDHDFESTETAPSFGGTVNGNFTTTIPQSVNLEFQTGIAEDTLLFGSVRWQDWSEFAITPPAFRAAAGIPLIEYQSDYTTYTISVGRRFNETWSGAVTLAHEPATGDLQGNLAPRDGFTSVGLAATYRREKTEITAGVRYIKLGDATTIPPTNARFEDNDAVAFGLRLTQRF